jgi:metacaspase-1
MCLYETLKDMGTNEIVTVGDKVVRAEFFRVSHRLLSNFREDFETNGIPLVGFVLLNWILDVCVVHVDRGVIAASVLDPVTENCRRQVGVVIRPNIDMSLALWPRLFLETIQIHGKAVSLVLGQNRDQNGVHFLWPHTRKKERMKRALLVGINYSNNKQNALSGCINDAKNLDRVLRTKFGFTQTTLLLEEKATRTAILAAISAEIAFCCTNKVNELWLSFSGHGSTLNDANGDETDGRDETFIGYDGAAITDDMVNVFLARLPSTTRTVIVFDSCHSGTMADLKYTYQTETKSCVESKTAKEISGRVLQISGCKDEQLSSDAWINREFSGAMTAALLAALEKNNYDVTVFKLLTDIREFLVSRNFTQVPQITSSKPLTGTSLFCTPKPEEPILYSCA